MTSLQITQFKFLIKPSPSIYAALYWSTSIKSLEHLTTSFVLNNYNIHVLCIGGAKKTLHDLTLLYFRMTLLEQKASKLKRVLNAVREGCYWDTSIKKLTIQQNAGRVIWKGDANVWHPQNYLKQPMKNTKGNTESSWKSIENQWTTICWELLLGLFFPWRIRYPETSP